MKKYLLFKTDKFNSQGLYKGGRYEIIITNEKRGIITFLNSIGDEKQVSTNYVNKGTDIILINKKGNFNLF